MSKLPRNQLGRFSAKADISSGDNPNSKTLGTFNPLFPKGNYFGVLANPKTPCCQIQTAVRRIKRGLAWSRSTLLHQRGSALANFLSRAGMPGRWPDSEASV